MISKNITINIPTNMEARPVALLVQGAPEVDTIYTHTTSRGSFTFDTREIRAVLGEGISLAEPEVAVWMRGYLEELEQSV